MDTTLKKLRPLLLVLFVLGGATLTAQDPLFSNYAPITAQLNPALTGFIPGRATTRVGIVGREQWNSFLEAASFRTLAAAVDHRICGKGRGDYVGLGAHLVSDWQGEPGLRRTDGLVSAAFTKNLSSRFYGGTTVSLGAEIGFIQYDLDAGGLTFDDQFGNPAAPGERLDFYNLSLLDYGAGVVFTWVEDLRSSLTVSGGLGIKHIGKPANTFVDDGRPNAVSSDSSAQLTTRWTPHLRATLPVAARRSISLFGMYTYQRPHNQAMLSALFNFERPGGQQALPVPVVSVGGGYRFVRGIEGLNSESLILSGRVSIGPIDLGLNYDVNLSSLRTSTQGAGALELNISMVFGQSDCLICPRL